MAPKRRQGEKDKLTPDVHRIIVESVAAGVPLKWSAVRGGVTERCLQQWMARGRQAGKANEKYRALFSAIKKAQADAVAVRVARIGRAAQGGLVERTTTTTRNADGTTKTVVSEKICPGEWTADAWYLERIHNDHFGSNRAEIKALQKQVSELMERTKSFVSPAPTASEGEPGSEGHSSPSA